MHPRRLLETMDVVGKVGYDSAFTFIYSKRSGTPAAAKEDQVPEEVVKDRFDSLLAQVQEIARERSSRFEGTVQEVLADPGRKSVPAVIQLCRLYGGGKRNWRYGNCSSRKYQFRTFSDHWFRNWADRRIGNLYFSVFWMWQL